MSGFEQPIDRRGNRGSTTIVPKVLGPAAITPAPGSTSATAVDYMSITLPSAGNWAVTYAVRGFSQAAGGGLAAFLATAANVEIAGSKILVIFGDGASVQNTATGRVIVTTTGSQVIKVRLHSIGTLGAGASDATNGLSWVMAESLL